MYRSTDVSGPFTLLNASLIIGTTYFDGTTQPGITYDYYVAAVDSELFEGKASTVVSFTGATLTISPTVLPHATQDENYSEALSASGGTGPYTFVLTSGTLPAGISLATDGTLSGIPTESGSFNFTVTVSDPNACGSQALTLVVDLSPCAAASLTISPSTVPNATINQNYNQLLTASGGTAPYTFTLNTGALPPGVSLASDGTLSGSPSQTGSFDFVIAVSDALAACGSRGYTLIVDLPSCAGGGLVISPASLPNATIGANYNQALTASGGTGPYSFFVTTGVLPAGLTLLTDGTLSGIPSETGSFDFVITVSDPTDCGTQAFTLIVNPPCLFCDDFEDGVLAPDWTYSKPVWNETGGMLIATNSKKVTAIADPVFAGCSTCSIEASMQMSAGSKSQLRLIGWYQSKSNQVELLLKQQNGKLILKQHGAGSTVRTKIAFAITPATFYTIRMDFDGADFHVFVDNVLVITAPKIPASSPLGTVGFFVKATTGTFGYITVN